MRCRREERGESLLDRRGRKVIFPMDITVLLSPDSHFIPCLYFVSTVFSLLHLSFYPLILFFFLVSIEISQCRCLRLGCSCFSIVTDISVQYTSIPVKLKII